MLCTLLRTHARSVSNLLHHKTTQDKSTKGRQTNTAIFQTADNTPHSSHLTDQPKWQLFETRIRQPKQAPDEPSGQCCPRAVYLVSPRLVYLKSRVRYDSSLWSLTLCSKTGARRLIWTKHRAGNRNDWRKRIKRNNSRKTSTIAWEFSLYITETQTLSRRIQKRRHVYLGNPNWIEPVMSSKLEPKRTNFLHFRAKTGEVIVLNLLNILTNKEIPLCECNMLVISATMPLVDYRYGLARRTVNTWTVQ